MIPRICPELTSKLLDELVDVHYVSGNMENKFMELAGVNAVLSLASGREALFHALGLAEIGQGDEVIIPSLNCNAVAEAITATGATAVLADVLEDSTIDPHCLDSLYSKKTKAIVAVHFNGVPCRVEQLQHWCNEHRVLLIEDAAQALGATYQGRWVGTFGDLSIFSFAFDKHITAGAGGLLVVNNPQYFDALSRLQGRGLKPSAEQEDKCLQLLERNLAIYLPRNYWFGRFYQRVRQKIQRTKPFFYDQNHPRLLGERQSALIFGQLDYIDEWNKQRRNRCEWYENGLESLPGYIRTLPIKNDSGAVPLRYTLRMPNDKRTRAAQNLLKNGIECGPFIYSAPLHQKSEVANKCRFSPSELGESESQTRELLNLPIHSWVSQSTVEQILGILAQS